jgi:hypothetical protein
LWQRSSDTKTLMSTTYPTRSIGGIEMVYCQKCGTMNPDNACFCTNCGASLPCTHPDYGAQWRQRNHDREHYREYYRGGSGWGALFAGVIIIVIGLIFLLSILNGVPVSWSEIWAIVIIFVGLWLLGVAFRRSSRSRPRPVPPT